MRNESRMKFLMKDKVSCDFEVAYLAEIKNKIKDKFNDGLEVLDITVSSDLFDNNKFITQNKFSEDIEGFSSISSKVGRYKLFKRLVSKYSIKHIYYDLKGIKVYLKEDILKALKQEDYKLFVAAFL
jgi:hypothetical protein